GEDDGEGGAAPGLALDPDLAAHELAEVTGDRQTETGAAEAAVDVLVGLAEGAEDGGELVPRDADAGVVDDEFEPAHTGGGEDVDGEADRADVGELVGVAEEVVEA